jgi:glycosyltransferase involved in cell wall biosynthesis/2-polyprenyl-3-methyl-5-hydroxy-6-metoxy-1,4-benzoquinol methylase
MWDKKIQPPHRILVFAATYNEKGNVMPLLERIFAAVPEADVLIVDDGSPDGTGQYVDQLAQSDPRIAVIHRPNKLGLGTAHQLAMLYALKKGYTTLVTMDADLSHDPAAIPSLLAKLEEAHFVTGSRYMPGGACDYRGYRRFVSVAANVGARMLLGLQLHEFTTSFRAFRVDALAKVNFIKLRNQGYGFFMEAVYRLHQAGLRLAEVPIHFGDRYAGDSKIPRFEILRGMLQLLHLSTSRLLGRTMPERRHPVGDRCAYCGAGFLIDRFARTAYGGKGEWTNAFRCSSMMHKDKPRVVKCLVCGLVQVPRSEQPGDLEDAYANVVDSDYLQNMPSKRRTFARALEQVRPFLPSPGRLLEIGSYCGLFLDEARRQGWTVRGVEPSRWAADYARRTFGVDVLDGTWDATLPKLDGPFDAIVSWDVLEHVRDPAKTLRDAHSLLRHGGVLCISTLDAGTWFPRMTGSHWPWLMEMHLFYFDRDVLARMFQHAGFEVLAVQPYRHYASLRYIFRKVCASLPGWSGKVLAPHARLVPEISVPVSLGDVKLFVGRKP